MSKNIVFEGWLTKSPPSKRIWRTKWRRRWFALRQSGELPGQYFLDYYADRNCRRLKGTINLDLCEQVDAGLHMERAGNGTVDPKLRGCVFTIQTQSRIYHLEADCEDEMGRWVDAICQVCGLRPTEEIDVNDAYQINRVTTVSTINAPRRANTTGPYIPISECITGVRAQDQQRAFNFESGNTNKATCDKSTETELDQQIKSIVPRIKINNVYLSETESNMSDEDCKSLNTSQSNILARSLTKVMVTPTANDDPEAGPPVPPRPPKTFIKMKESLPKETFQGPKIQEPVETVQELALINPVAGPSRLSVPPRVSHSTTPPQTPSRPIALPPPNTQRGHTDDEEEFSLGNQSTQYTNLTATVPPAVDRALKPRFEKRPPAPNYVPTGYRVDTSVKTENELQYLDLDLPIASASDPIVIHGKDAASVGPKSEYKTVDFVKTEAFNSTRQDAEAFRNYQY